MTRGPMPYDTFREAAEIPGRRGTLKWFHRADGDNSHFAIFGIDFVSLVGIRRAPGSGQGRRRCAGSSMTRSPG